MRRDHVLQFVLEAAQTPDFQGVTAQAVADALSIWRNDAAVELNKLVAEGKLRRVGKKNVRFFPASEETADIPAGAGRAGGAAAGRGGDRTVPGVLRPRRRGRQPEISAAGRHGGRCLSPERPEYAHHRLDRQRQEPFCQNDLGIRKGDEGTLRRACTDSLRGVQLRGICGQSAAAAVPPIRL